MTLQDHTDALLVEQQLPLEEGLLISAGVVRKRAQEPTSGHTSQVWRIQLETGQLAFFKAQGSSGLASDYGHNPDEVFLNDCAAWRLAAALGRPYRDLATPCVVRLIDNETGSLIAERIKTGDWPPSMDDLWAVIPEQARDAAFFDGLIGQQDRHDGNFRFRDDTNQLALIDHGFSFPGGEDHDAWYFNESFLLQHRWDLGEQALAEHEIRALHIIASSPSVLGLDGILSPGRLDRLHARIGHMIDTGELVRPGQW